MIQRGLSQQERQDQREITDMLIVRIDADIAEIVTWPTTGRSSYDHALGAIQHLRQAIADLDCYKSVL